MAGVVGHFCRVSPLPKDCDAILQTTHRKPSSEPQNDQFHDLVTATQVVLQSRVEQPQTQPGRVWRMSHRTAVIYILIWTSPINQGFRLENPGFSSRDTHSTWLVTWCDLLLNVFSTIFWYGYGSIPIHTIFRGMNIHLPAILMFTRGIGFWPIPIFDIPHHLFHEDWSSSQKKHIFLRPKSSPSNWSFDP